LAAIAVVGFFTPITAPYALQPRAWATPTLGSVYFWATLALWAFLFVNFSLAGRTARDSIRSCT